MDTTTADVDSPLDPVLDASLDLIDASNRTASAALRLVAAATPAAREQARSLLLALDELGAAQDQLLAAVTTADQ